MKEGGRPDGAYILKSGSVAIIKNRSGGGETILSTLSKGDIFGEMSMVDAKPRSATVKALEDVTLTVIDAQTFKQKQDALDIFSRKLVETLIRRLRVQNQQIADMSNPSQLLKAAQKGQVQTSHHEGGNVLIKEDYREKIDFGAIRLLFGDVNPQARQSIKGGLHMQGFREIEDLSYAKDFRKRVMSDAYDLIVIDGNLGVEEIAPVIKDIRYGETFLSPFVVIFAIIDHPDPNTLELLASAGLDDVLVKPVALGNIIDRIERRIKTRKPFVVTMDYIGPDRRNTNRLGLEKIPLVNVPNPLAYKALGLIDDAQYAKEAAQATQHLEELKIERDVVQIDWLRAKITSLMAANKDLSHFMGDIISFVKALIIKLSKKGKSDHIEICEKALSMLNDFEADRDKMSGDDWDEFSQITQKLKADLGPQN